MHPDSVSALLLDDTTAPTRDIRVRKLTELRKVVVLLGFVKGRLVIQYFMAVNTAPRWLKLATDAWLFTLWAAVLAIYLY